MVFEGTSQNGDLHEALAGAIRKAKNDLTTDHITWTLEKVSGENGGFVQVNNVTVTISAKGP